MKRALLFGGVPVIAGLALIALWLQADQAASRGNDWTQVIATVESSTAQPDGLDLAYNYDYGGRQYRNPSGHLTIRQGAKSSAKRYTAGREVLAYVNPTSASESLLEPLPRPSSANLIAGIVLLIIGLPVATYFLRARPTTFVRSRNKRKPVRKPPTRRPMERLKPPPRAPRK
jgi:hypothetical protein